MKRVLFLCTHNSARSQMAEGLLRRLGGNRFQAYSAPTRSRGRLHPLAMQAMAEAGIDISAHKAKDGRRFEGEAFEYVVTVCDEARESCPVFPGAARQLHWSLPNPSAAKGSEEERLAVFRGVRDRLAARISEFVSGVEK